MAKTFQVDVPPVTADEATELMIHHLQLAHSYFQIAPEGQSTRSELERNMLRAGYSGSPLSVASRAWFDVMTDEYKRMKENER